MIPSSISHHILPTLSPACALTCSHNPAFPFPVLPMKQADPAEGQQDHNTFILN